MRSRLLAGAMTPGVSIVVAFALVWLLIHGRVLSAAALALIALPVVLLAVRRRGPP